MRSSNPLSLARPWLMAFRLGCVLLFLAGLTEFSAAAPLDAASSAVLAPNGKSSIGDYVWYDANVDGNHLGTEAEWTAGIDHVLVNLYMDKNADGVMDPGELIDAQYTGDNPLTVPVEPPGFYRFTDLVVDPILGTLFWVELAPSNFLPGGALYGYFHTSQGTYGANPLPVFLPADQDFVRADFGYVHYDWGDLPSPYPTLLANNGPRHVVLPLPSLRLGNYIDGEPDGQPNPTATGDDTNGVQNDEDGVSYMPRAGGSPWSDGTVPTGGGSLQIVINGSAGVPQVFMDFGVGLTAVVLKDAAGNPLALTMPAGVHRVYFDIPAGTFAPGNSTVIPVRVRLSSAGGLTAIGQAPDGEVEDHIYNFTPTAVTLSRLSGSSPTPPLLPGLAAGALGLCLYLGFVRRRRSRPA
jgi:hypothetical protein